MEIKIKPGDRVRFCDEIVRVMEYRTIMSNPAFRLSRFGWINGDLAKNIELVESIPDTALKDGDKVIIHNIPNDEKDAYGVIWLNKMENLMMSDKVHTVEKIKYHGDYGWIGRIGGCTFQLYHIEPAHSFDII